MTAAPVAAPSSAPKVRRPALGIDDAIPQVWHSAGPFATHFLDALSSVFPDGEAFFVKSVQHYRGEIEDPELLRAIRGFAGQEAQHSHQHDRHMDLLRAQGYRGLAARNAVSRWFMKQSLRFAPRQSLVATAALEHLTAILARQLLSHPERFLEPMHEQMAPLWQWHALEEAEHKAVAYDVMQHVGVPHFMKCAVLILNTVALLGETYERTAYMLWKDGKLFDRKVWRDGNRFLWGHGGLFRGVGPDYRLWFRRDFHPNDVDDRPLIARTGLLAATSD
jgi:predicted metal-dependent hydrolase